MDKKYDEAISALPMRYCTMLGMLDGQLKGAVQEVNIRVNKPITLQAFGGTYFITSNGKALKHPTSECVITRKSDLNECMKMLTGYSIHSYKEQINSGFITVKGGHRVGVVGSCCYNKDKLLDVNDIAYINIRIAREIKGVSKKLIEEIYNDKICSTLIVGSPTSGKTTLLRDIAFALSSGATGKYYKTCIIDERGELASMQAGVPQNQVGVLCDVLDGYKKGEGMRLAIRSMSPQIIVLDEIGGVDDVNAITQSVNSGVCTIATIHANSIAELYKKEFMKGLLENCFEYIVLLKDTKIAEIVRVDAVC